MNKDNVCLISINIFVAASLISNDPVGTWICLGFAFLWMFALVLKWEKW